MMYKIYMYIQVSYKGGTFQVYPKSPKSLNHLNLTGAFNRKKDGIWLAVSHLSSKEFMGIIKSLSMRIDLT